METFAITVGVAPGRWRDTAIIVDRDAVSGCARWYYGVL